jgi:hypothetical protein
MGGVRFLALVIASGLVWQMTAVADELGPAGDDAVRQAVARYLAEIDEINKEAVQARAAARARLLDALGQPRSQPEKESPKTAPGLIGAATIEGEPAGVAFHYEHGKLFDRELIWSRFHQPIEGGIHFPNVTITLLGQVEVAQPMTVKVSQAAGGVNGDHGTLFIGDRQIGQVGDDTAKAEVYLLTLPAGIHPVRWVLTGGTFQHSLLKFEDPSSGELLPLSYTADQRHQSGAAAAREHVEAAADPTEWLKGLGTTHWRWVPVAK